METVNFKNAYYIKLGKNSCWAYDSFESGIVRIGWSKVPLDDINAQIDDIIKKKIQTDYSERGKKNGATQDFKALKRFTDATEEDLFVTFYGGKMYWCNLSNGPVQGIDEAKYRETKNGWSCSPINNSQKFFFISEIPGIVSKTQAFQGTICQFGESQTKILSRLLNGEDNPTSIEIKKKRDEICDLLTELIRGLYPKDCEVLADLIFQHSGWHRVSPQGGNQEFIDMEYLDSINNERYVVQVKSGADRASYVEYEKRFSGKEFKKLFFVAFNPKESLEIYVNKRADVEILFGKRLSEKIFDLGLLNWVLKKCP
jgi:hypothetical protein